jgi:hypothetical protein
MDTNFLCLMPLRGLRLVDIQAMSSRGREAHHGWVIIFISVGSFSAATMYRPGRLAGLRAAHPAIGGAGSFLGGVGGGCPRQVSPPSGHAPQPLTLSPRPSHQQSLRQTKFKRSLEPGWPIFIFSSTQQGFLVVQHCTLVTRWDGQSAPSQRQTPAQNSCT